MITSSADMAPTHRKVGAGLTVTGWCNTGTHDSKTEREIIRQGRITCTCECHKEEQ